MKTPEPGGATPPTPPASATEPAQPPRSEALEAELAMLEAVLPDEPAALQPESDAGAGATSATVLTPAARRRAGPSP